MNLLAAVFALILCGEEMVASCLQLAGREPDRVGRIILLGNDITQDRVILMNLPFQTGEVLHYSQLEKGRQTLLRMRVFELEDPPRVEVLPDVAPGRRYKDILVVVKETPTGGWKNDFYRDYSRGVTDSNKLR